MNIFFDQTLVGNVGNTLVVSGPHGNQAAD